MTHLNDISDVYMEKVAKPDFLDLDKDGNKKEPMKKAAVEAPAERLKTDRDGYRVPKKDADAAKERLLAKARAKRAKMSEGLDPVGKEDGDVDNDGKKNTKSDKYLLNRRKAIGKAMKEGTSKDVEVPSKDLVKLAKKAANRIDTNVSGDVNKKDKSMGDYGEFVPSPDGKKKVTTKIGEGYSNWRDDLREVVGEDGEESKQVKEKNVKNTITINPKISEEVTILENTEMDEVDLAVYTVYDELVQEGFDVYDVEDAVEYAIIEATVTFGHDTDKPHKKDTSTGRMVKAVGRLARQKLKSTGKKAKLKSAQAQVAAYNKGREAAQTAGDKVRKAKASAAAAPKKAKKGVKSMIKKAAQKVVNRMSEETSMEMSPQEIALQKKKAMVDQQIAQKRKQALGKVTKEETEDSLRDRRMERGGVDGNNRYKSATKPTNTAGKKKPYDGMSALEKVKASIRAKHGQGAIMDTKKK